MGDTPNPFHHHHHQERTHHDFDCPNMCKTYMSWLRTCLSTPKSGDKMLKGILCNNKAEGKNEFRKDPCQHLGFHDSIFF